MKQRVIWFSLSLLLALVAVLGVGRIASGQTDIGSNSCVTHDERFFFMSEGSCGQSGGGQIESVSIEGPNEAYIGINYTFEATVLPLTATLPVTYTWEATNQLPVVQSSGLSDIIRFTWPLPGNQMITVTVDNGVGTPISITHAVSVHQPTLTASPTCMYGPKLAFVVTGTEWVIEDELIALYWVEEGEEPLISSIFPAGHEPTIGLNWFEHDVPNGSHAVLAESGGYAIEVPIQVPCIVPPISVSIEGKSEGLIESSYTFVATTSPISATRPITYVWETTNRMPITQTGSITDAMSFTWSSQGSKTITVTADNGLGDPVSTQHVIDIYEPSLTVTPVCSTEPDIEVTLSGEAWGDPDLPILLYWVEEGEPALFREFIPLGHSPDFERTWQLTDVPAGTHYVRAQSGEFGIEAPLMVPCEADTIQSVDLDGPMTGIANTPYNFIASVLPATAQQPITYIWEATGFTPITQTNGLTDTINFSWATPGEKTVSVTVYNGVGAPITVSLTVEIEMRLWLPIILNKP